MDEFDAVARTSLLTTALRARETARPDRLYSDPLAAKLAGTVGAALFDTISSVTLPNRDENSRHKLPSTVDYNAIRTRFFDEYLLNAVTGGDIEQVVLAAAGMDTRAYRLDWPKPVRLFELDRAPVLAAKESALAGETVHPMVTRHAVPVDLTARDWVDELRRAGYEPAAPSVWLLEGLLYYIDEAAARQILAAVRAASSEGSLVAADIVNAVALTAPVMRPLLEVFEAWGCPWLFGSDEPEELFASYDIDAVAIQPGEQGAHYGRWPDAVRPRVVAGVERVFYVHGIRRQVSR